MIKNAVVILTLCSAVSAAENTKDPGKDGPFSPGWITAEIPDTTQSGEKLSAIIYYPAEAAEEKSPPGSAKTPWPVLIFSPGGPAKTYEGYEDVGKRMASWGIATLIVAFGDRPAEKRAPQFPIVREWLEKKNAEDGFQLKGKLDFKNVLVGGYSRGAAAAVLAADDRKNFVGCVAMGPALNKLPDGYTTPTLLIGSPDDLDACNTLFKSMKTPRWLYIVAGMDHYMKPADKCAVVLRYATVWVAVRVLMKDEFKSRLVGPEPRREKRDGVLSEMRVDE